MVISRGSSTTTTILQPSSENARTITLDANFTLLTIKPRPKKKVTWDQDTIDNEGMNKKSSKCCCIFHKKHRYDADSSDSEDGCNFRCEKSAQDKCHETKAAINGTG